MTERTGKHRVTVPAQGLGFTCAEGETILEGMRKAGVKTMVFGCMGGGCGVCKVKIISGHVEVKKMSRAHVSVRDEREGIVLACRAIPKGEVSIQVFENTTGEAPG